MPYLLAGFLVFWLALYGLRAFSHANPAVLARSLNRLGGVLAFAVAAFLLVRGRPDIAVFLGALGYWLFMAAKKSPSPMFRGRGSATSRVRSAVIEMELDHATGTIRGTVLAGVDEGKTLDQMTQPQCEALYRLCLRDDPEGSRLLEAYLDRRFPGWRAANNGRQDPGGRRQGAPRPGVMSEDEAYEVLGLHKGATRDDVVRSHRSLMKKLHPDHGGSTDLAARVNEAKDVLMRRHH